MKPIVRSLVVAAAISLLLAFLIPAPCDAALLFDDLIDRRGFLVAGGVSFTNWQLVNSGDDHLFLVAHRPTVVAVDVGEVEGTRTVELRYEFNYAPDLEEHTAWSFDVQARGVEAAFTFASLSMKYTATFTSEGVFSLEVNENFGDPFDAPDLQVGASLFPEEEVQEKLSDDVSLTSGFPLKVTTDLVIADCSSGCEDRGASALELESVVQGFQVRGVSIPQPSTGMLLTIGWLMMLWGSTRLDKRRCDRIKAAAEVAKSNETVGLENL